MPAEQISNVAWCQTAQGLWQGNLPNHAFKANLLQALEESQ
jgi:hypothetical protein